MIPNEHRRQLRELALLSISHGVQHGRAVEVDPEEWPQNLQQHRSSFVTLHKNSELRGCIGGLTASEPLVVDIAKHAYGAAFKDPRFEPVTHVELAYLDIHLSVLAPAESINCETEQDLVAMLRPGVDGLTIKDGTRQATFLPTVWDSLPKPMEFLNQLKQKAGFANDYWSSTITVERYTTESW